MARIVMKFGGTSMAGTERIRRVAGIVKRQQEAGHEVAVVVSAMAGETGCRIVLPEDADPFVTLFSESAGRVLVAVPRTEESRFRSMCEARGLPAARIGVVDQESDAIEVQGLFTVSLAELRETSEAVLPRFFA